MTGNFDNRLTDLNAQIVDGPSNSREKRLERGASLVEYAILVALIVIVAIAAIRTVGREVSESFSGIASSLNSAN